MDDVQGKLEKQEMHIQTLAQKINSPQVQETHTELAVLKIRLEMLEQQLADLKSQRQN